MVLFFCLHVCIQSLGTWLKMPSIVPVSKAPLSKLGGSVWLFSESDILVIIV